MFDYSLRRLRKENRHFSNALFLEDSSCKVGVGIPKVGQLLVILHVILKTTPHNETQLQSFEKGFFGSNWLCSLIIFRVSTSSDTE